MAWTQGQLDVLERALASGATTVEFDGRRVTFKSLAEMLQLRSLMRAELGIRKTGRSFTLSRYWKGTV